VAGFIAATLVLTTIGLPEEASLLTKSNAIPSNRLIIVNWVTLRLGSHLVSFLTEFCCKYRAGKAIYAEYINEDFCV
jgi:hypothetical protein